MRRRFRRKEPRTDTESAQAFVAKCDSLEIAARCAALSLEPANAEHRDYLSTLAGASLSQPGSASVEASWTDLIAASAALYQGPSRWDPHECLWTEPQAFFDGEHAVFSGGSALNRFCLDQVLRSIFLGDKVGDRTLRADLGRVATAVLRLSSHLVNASGVGRYARAPGRETKLPFLPSHAHLQRLVSAVDTTTAELEGIIGMSASNLSALTFDMEGDKPSPFSSGEPGFERFPIIRSGERFVIVSPMDLTIALRHALIAKSMRRTFRNQLANRLKAEAQTAVAFAAELMSWSILGSSEAEGFAQLVFQFDSDKAAVATIVHDDLSDYNPGAPEAPWRSQSLQEAFRGAVVQGEFEALVKAGFNEVLHLVVLAGTGRPAVFGISKGVSPGGQPVLMFGNEELETIAMSGLDSMELWEFALAGDRLRETCAVHVFDPIDEFSAWKAHDNSFYLGDERRPTALLFDGSYGRAIRERVAAERDRHPAQTPDGPTVEVARLHDDPAIPIYVVLNDLLGGGARVRQLVEGGPVPVWVSSSPDMPDHARPLAVDLVSCLAYWMWQFASKLPSFTAALQHPFLPLNVHIEDADAWDGDGFAPPGPVASTEIDETGVTVVIGRGMPGALEHADNRGERELMRVVLSQLDEIAASAGADKLGSGGIAAALDQVAPLGPKKKLNVFRLTTEAALTPVSASARSLRDARFEPLLDELGPVLVEQLSLQKGQIPPSLHEDVYKIAVAHHFQELEDLVATLNSEGLLEDLVTRCEALLNSDAMARYTFAARAACFGETKLITDLREELPRAANSAIATRFLIEYCAARPPAGVRPVSTGIIDEALAVASQIVNFGFAGDIVHFNLGQMDLSILGSGRLGQNRDASYYAGQQAFMDAAVPSYAREAKRRYSEAWNRAPGDRPAFADEFDRAAVAEWGVSITDLIALQVELTLMALPASFIVIRRQEVIDRLATALTWDSSKVERGIDMQSLGPRHPFSEPDPPFRRSDVYPWRFNRLLSYIRRPLLIREGAEGQELIWGGRQVEVSAKYLLDLVTSERLDARSRPMRRLMSRLRQEETREFVAAVAGLCQRLEIPAREHVRKVGGRRLRRRNGQDLGDIDVLAFDSSRRIIHALECKDLAGARTPAELANELEETFSREGSGRSAADTHLERTQWIVENLSTVLGFLGLNEVDGWRVQGRIVVDTEVLSPHVYNCRLPVSTYESLAEDLCSPQAPHWQS